MSQPSPIHSHPKKRRKIIQSDSETEKSPVSTKSSPVTRTENRIGTYKLFSHKHKINSKQKTGELNKLIINLNSDEEKQERDKIIDLPLSDSNKDDSETNLERKFQEDLREAIIRSQSDFAQNISRQSTVEKSSKTSTPKTKKKSFNIKEFNDSVRKLNERFSEQLNNIKTKFCLSEETFSD